MPDLIICESCGCEVPETPQEEAAAIWKEDFPDPRDRSIQVRVCTPCYNKHLKMWNSMTRLEQEIYRQRGTYHLN